MKAPRSRGDQHNRSTVTLKVLAEHLGLSPGTVSGVLNNSLASLSIPERTKKRILAAASELNYRPNFVARSLRVMRTHMIGVIVEEIGDPYSGMVMSGIEQYLRRHGFFFLTVVHRHDPKLLQTDTQLLLERGVEGLIAVGSSISQPPPLPAVAVAGHRRMKGVTNLVLDHRLAAQLALKYLIDLDHEEIVFMKGATTSSDAEDRWKAIVEVCQEMGIRMSRELIIQLQGDEITPELGYTFTKKLLSRRKPFTALFAYNDNSAIGAIRAIHETGLRVPEDISVVGFDDIVFAVFSIPPLTTVRQPLQKMGEIAARTLLKQMDGSEPYVSEIAVEPEFIVRGSTARANKERTALHFSGEEKRERPC
ncbi:MAG TPA: LacI family DNA-binding transcriptional regulator [Pyrinomonadaceae bacterium]|jgi:DNA-binding LacI/PurR family transcriptional regulator